MGTTASITGWGLYPAYLQPGTTAQGKKLTSCVSRPPQNINFKGVIYDRTPYTCPQSLTTAQLPAHLMTSLHAQCPLSQHCRPTTAVLL